MGSFSETARNTMLDALTVDRIQLHSGDPGAAGASNVVSDTLTTAAFDAAVTASRAMSSDVAYTGLDSAQTVTYVSFWDNNSGSPIFHGSSALTGDQAANVAGEYTVKGTTTTISLT